MNLKIRCRIFEELEQWLCWKTMCLKQKNHPRYNNIPVVWDLLYSNPLRFCFEGQRLRPVRSEVCHWRLWSRGLWVGSIISALGRGRRTAGGAGAWQWRSFGVLGLAVLVGSGLDAVWLMEEVGTWRVSQELVFCLKVVSLWVTCGLEPMFGVEPPTQGTSIIRAVGQPRAPGRYCKIL